MVKRVSKYNFHDFLNLGTKESLFTFSNKFYIQVGGGGAAMGSPLGPILANIFLSHHEENWLNKFFIEVKPNFYRRYVDDIFALLNQLNLPTRFPNIYLLTVNLSLVSTKNQHLAEFSPIMKVSFQSTKTEEFYTHHFIGVLANVRILRHFILKSII